MKTLLMAFGCFLLGGSAALAVPGDVNGDSRVDLSDPVHLLLYLYREGPAPAPDAAVTALEEELAECQSLVSSCDAQCVGDLLEAIARLRAENDLLRRRPIQLAASGEEAALAACGGGIPWNTRRCGEEGRFTVTAATVVDNCTALEWSRQTWEGVPYCDAVWLRPDADAGATTENIGTWRTPTISELLTLARWDVEPYVAEPFSGLTGAVWSSTAATVGGDERIRVFDPVTGTIALVPPGEARDVLLVRDVEIVLHWSDFYLDWECLLSGP